MLSLGKSEIAEQLTNNKEIMKFRPQRRTLADAMAECVELEPTLQALATHLRTSIESIEVEPYSYDDRIKWNSHIVMVDGHVFGFTDGPISVGERQTMKTCLRHQKHFEIRCINCDMETDAGLGGK